MELRLVPKGEEAGPQYDRIDLAEVRDITARRTIKRAMRIAITRLYGQVFTSRDIHNILSMDKNYSYRPNLYATVRANLLDMAKADELLIAVQGKPGRGSQYVAAEFKEIDIGLTNDTQGKEDERI
jgi:hypothetical protein